MCLKINSYQHWTDLMARNFTDIVDKKDYAKMVGDKTIFADIDPGTNYISFTIIKLQFF